MFMLYDIMMKSVFVTYKGKKIEYIFQCVLELIMKLSKQRIYSATSRKNHYY